MARRAGVALVVCANLALAAGPPAHADSDGAMPGVSASAPDAGGLEDVIVYARRRAERVIDVPLAVTVLSGVQLQNQSAVLFEDIAREIPNVRMVSSPQSVSALDVTMRGQTVNRSAITFDPAVGLYIDGVYVANGQGAMGTLLDIDAVEVVRGAQGTLFGRNNTGGSISLRTRRPELDTYDGEVAASAGNYRAYMGRAIVNVPIADSLALRVAVQSNDRAGFGSSIGSGQGNYENQHRYQLRAGVLWKPAAGTEAYFTYERFHADEVGAVLHPLAGPAPGTLVAQIGGALAQFPIPGLPTVSFPSDPFQTASGYGAYDRSQTDAFHLTLTQDLPGIAKAKLILGYRRLSASAALDVDASTLPLADTALSNTSAQKSAELQFSGNADDARLDWVAGAYWFRDHGGAPSVQAPASPTFLAALNAVSQATGGQVNLTPYFSPLPVYDQNVATNTSAAGFVHLEYAVTRSWSIAGGVRRTGDRRELDENSYVNVPQLGQQCTILDATAPPPFQIQGPCPELHKSVSYGFWSWELATRLRLSERINAYARAGRSQRSGGWNAPLATLQDTPFRPEQLTDFEVGLKAQPFGEALMVNAALFYGRYDDMQRLLARLNPDGTPVTLVTNAGRARVSGAELEAAWHLNANTSVRGSAGYTDAKYQTFDYQPLPGGAVQDLSRNSFYQTPRAQASIGAAYRLPIARGVAGCDLDYAWQDRVQFNVINDFNYQRAYGTLNARASFGSVDSVWEVALFATNVTDRRYAYTGGTLGAPFAPAPTIAWQVPGAPRLYGIEAVARFGARR